MKATGSLLRETLEQEAAIAKLLAETKAEAQEMLDAAAAEADMLKKNAIRSAEEMKAAAERIRNEQRLSIANDGKEKASLAVREMHRLFGICSDTLAAETAERILRHDT